MTDGSKEEDGPGEGHVTQPPKLAVCTGLPCTSRKAAVGDRVMSQDGTLRTALDGVQYVAGSEIGPWELKPGEVATVAGVDDDGNFRLANPDGLESEFVFHRFYAYIQEQPAFSLNSEPEEPRIGEIESSLPGEVNRNEQILSQMADARNAEVSDRPPSPPLDKPPQLPDPPEPEIVSAAARAVADIDSAIAGLNQPPELAEGAEQTCPPPIEAFVPGQGTPGQTLLPTLPVQVGLESSDGSVAIVHTGQATSQEKRSASKGSKRSGSKGSGSKEKQGLMSLQELDDMTAFKKDKEDEEAKLLESHAKAQAIQQVGARQAAIGNDVSKTECQQVVTAWITWWPFDSFIGLCIVLNAMTIGAEAQSNARKEAVPVWVEVLEYVFLVIYTIEILLRLYADRLRAFRSHWVKFDFCLVLVGLANFGLTLALAGSSPEELSQVMMIRMLRLARLARAVRLMVQFKVLWLLVRGLMSSAYMLLWTGLLLLIIVYIFGLIGLELIGKDESMPADYQLAASKFNSGLVTSVITMLGITFYQGGHVYREMAIEKPALTVFFLSYHLIVGVALLGLVIAIMCQSAIAQSKQDHESVKAWEEAKKKALMPKLKNMFLDLDTDGGGTVSMDEIRDAPEELVMQMREIAQIDNIEELFKMLDSNKDGELQIGEFCEGLMKNGDSDKPMELHVIMKQCSKTSAHLQDIRERHDELQTHIEQLETRLSARTADLGEQLANLQRGVDFIVKCLSRGSVPRGARADTTEMIAVSAETVVAREMEVFDTMPLPPAGLSVAPLPPEPPAGAGVSQNDAADSGIRERSEESGDRARSKESGDRPNLMSQDELEAMRSANRAADEEEERLAARRDEQLAVAKFGVRGAALRRSNGSLIITDMKSLNQIRVTTLITWWPFDSFIGIMIMLNAVTIGVESEAAAMKDPVPMWVQVLEHIFFVVYFVELALRIYADRLDAFKSAWVKFDAMLVFIGCMNLALTLALAGESPEELSKVMMIRMLRLARLARAVRLMVQFKVLWQLVRGLMASAGMLFWVIVVMLAVMYIFAILAVELIQEDTTASVEYQEAAKLFIRGIGSSILVLLNVAFPGGKYFIPICWEKPELILYFLVFLMIVIVSLFSLVVALMAQAAMESARDDKETERAWEDARKKAMMPKLRSMFSLLDADGSGEVSLEEIQSASPEMQEQLKHISGMDDMAELFGLLDYDNGGELDIEEFCDGLLHAGTSGKPMELFVIMKQCSRILEYQDDIKLEQVKLGAQIQDAEYKLTGGIESQLAMVQKGVAQIVKSLSHTGQAAQPEPIWDLSKLLIIEEC